MGPLMSQNYVSVEASKMRKVTKGGKKENCRGDNIL